MTEHSQTPSGFVLSDSAMYAFQCQDVFPDILSFAVAIPDYLKNLFLIPVFVEKVFDGEGVASIASKIAEIVPTGESDASDLFSYQSFVNHDNEPNITPGEEGSIYDPFTKPDDMPVSQPGDQFCGGEPRYDARIWNPDSTSYMTDGDSTDLMINEGYPYRTNEQVRHSSMQPMPIRIRMAIKPEVLQEHTPEKIRDNASACSVKFISYYKPSRMYTFSVHCGNVPHMVRAVLSEIDEVAMTCDCPFWRWNGPEFHGKNNKFLLGNPRGTASPPDVRDPDRKYWMCKHAYSVLRHLEHHVQTVVNEHWDIDDNDLLNVVDSEWDRLSQEAETPIEEIEAEDPVVVEPTEEEPEKPTEEEPEEPVLPDEEPEEEPEEEEPVLPDEEFEEKPGR